MFWNFAEISCNAGSIGSRVAVRGSLYWSSMLCGEHCPRRMIEPLRCVLFRMPATSVERGWSADSAGWAAGVGDGCDEDCWAGLLQPRIARAAKVSTRCAGREMD